MDFIPTLLQLPWGQEQRYNDLASLFQQTFNRPPDIAARAPGRVNLIGEHIDYEGYGVLPVATQQDCAIAIARGGNAIELATTLPEHPSCTFQAHPSQDIDTSKHSWGNYVLAAYKGVHNYLNARGITVGEPLAFCAFVDGNIPTGAGLSSSSALVCAAAVAILGMYDVSATQAEVSDLTCACERYIGTEGGGMDQAIAITAQAGYAKFVEFVPKLRTQDVKLPKGGAFVIANSLAVCNKADAPQLRYNLRVLECRLAAMVLGKLLGLPAEAVAGIKVLRDVEEALVGRFAAEALAGQAAELGISMLLHEGPYSQEEIEGLLEASLTKLVSDRPALVQGLQAGKSAGFQLRDRAMHVFGEAERVRLFKAVCEGPDPPAAKLPHLAALMDASHASCARLYECSCPELDELVATAKAAGALGARLTGAGWGGCMVALVETDNAADFIKQLKSDFYMPRVQQGVTSLELLSKHVFATTPSSGASLIRL